VDDDESDDPVVETISNLPQGLHVKCPLLLIKADCNFDNFLQVAYEREKHDDDQDQTGDDNDGPSLEELMSKMKQI